METLKNTHIKYSGITDKGRCRQANEDSLSLTDNGIFIVSDGMGGRPAGATASKITVDILTKMLKKIDSNDASIVAVTIRNTIFDFSQQLFTQTTERPNLTGMGATVVVAYFLNQKLFIAHMGDSRAYLFRNRELKLLTTDHSVSEYLLQTGDISAEQAKKHPSKNVLLRYVGMQDPVYPEVQTLDLCSYDRVLLCSDGLTNEVREEKIASTLENSASSEEACRCLVKTANDNGGNDNITAVVIDWF